MTYYYESELYHHGIKGQKWGVRRYQNEDGTLTEAGKKRSESERSGLNNDQLKNYKDNPSKWVNDDLNSARDIANNARNAMSSAQTALKNSKPSMKSVDLSSMTDQELREKINREMLERQYKQILTEQNTGNGREYLDRILSTAGAVTGIVSSALGIALAIQKLKGNG